MIGKIKSKEEIAQGTLQVTFETNEQFSFQAGQYIFISLLNPPYPDEGNNRRHFSIVSSPDEKRIITIATRLRDSGFKKNLKDLPLGSEVKLGPISGSFVLPENTQRPLVFLAGGIGITPFISMLRYEKAHNLGHKITLIYSNKDQSSTAFLVELQNLQTQLPNFKLILTMTEDPNWRGEKRRIDTTFIKQYFADVNSNNYFVVGPPPMVEAVRKALQEAGVEDANIKIENFTGY